MFTTIFALIDTRSFSNIWYWIAVAGIWSLVSRRVLGVPLELVVRARHEALAAQQMRVLLEEVAVRLRPGLGQVLLASCGLTVLVVLGFGHGLQLAQAIALLLVPLAAVRLMNLRAARRVAAILPGETEPVVRMLLAHHTLVQFFGFAMIGATALYGMLRVLRAHYLGS
ncbi:component of SufBCD complex [Paenirhodobacter sp.]|jgi:hypothetical protein|uniref:component of SufBCD complex n=1 Tax=Paenirhodobacter sp. TaxID=1965326 RepID=UPI003B510E31